MTRYSFSCLLFVLSMVSPLHILTAILAGLTQVRHEVDWVLLLNIFRTSRDVPFLFFVQTGSNQTRLSRPSVVSLFLVELFQLQNHPSSKSLWRPQQLGLYAALPFSPYAPVDPEISSSSLALAARRLVCSAFLYLARFGRSSRSCLFPSLLFRQRSSRASVVVLPLAFSRIFFFPRCPGCYFTCYRCICSYLTHSFGLFPSYLYIRSIRTSLPLHSIHLVRFQF